MLRKCIVRSHRSGLDRFEQWKVRRKEKESVDLLE